MALTRTRIRALLSFLVFSLLSVAALADPPTRVARLAHVNGNASFSPGGERDWGRAVINRPLVTGDRLWVDRGSRAELQMGTVAVRAAGPTNLTLLNLDDRITQIQLTQGTLQVSVRRLDRGEIVEINTPNLAFSIRRPGNYRIEVDLRDDWTEVAVMQGRARVFGERRAFLVNERQSYVFYGAGLDDYEAVALRRPGEFDRWAANRERLWLNSPSRRHVSPEMIGFADLDRFGSWRTVPQLGPVWIPRSVAADWAPYRDGHWSWIDPWGWTWIDAEPWGFAPSHYGRWTRVDNRWAWVPGPANVRPVYAPAVVAFVGNGSPGAANSTVAWFPLGPRDVYRPAYTTSREYFYNVNASARVERQQITAIYDNRNVNVTYVNQQVPGAIIAVAAAAFLQSQPVARVTVRVTDEGIRRAPVLFAPRVVPQKASLMGPAAAPAARPPEVAPARPVVAQVAPPPPPPPFSARQGALAANPGKPLDPAAVAAIKPAAPASAAVVKVVPETEAVAVPKARASASPAAADRRARRQQRDGESPEAAAPARPASAAPGAAATAPASADPRPEAGGRQRGPEARQEREGERRPGAAQQPASAAAAPAPAAPAPAAPAATAPAGRASSDARPGAGGRQRAQEAREAREERDRGGRPGAAQQPASAAVAPAAAPAGPGANGRQRAQEAREAREARETAREERERGRRPEAAQQPAAAPAAASPAPATPAAPPARAASAPTPAEAAAPAVSRPSRPERRGERARPAASAASAPADAASAPQRR